MPTPSSRQGGPMAQVQAVLERVREFGLYPTTGWGVWSPTLTEWFNPGGDRPYHYSLSDAQVFIKRARMNYATGDWRIMKVPLDESGEPAGPAQEADLPERAADE